MKSCSLGATFWMTISNLGILGVSKVKLKVTALTFLLSW